VIGESGGRVVPLGYLPSALQALRDAITYQQIRGTAVAREQAALYRALGRELGLSAEGAGGAELAARRTAAAAVLGDFRRALDTAPLAEPPPMTEWALRLSAELDGLLAGLDRLPGAEL
jgi:hypothetical protein